MYPIAEVSTLCDWACSTSLVIRDSAIAHAVVITVMVMVVVMACFDHRDGWKQTVHLTTSLYKFISTCRSLLLLQMSDDDAISALSLLDASQAAGPLHSQAWQQASTPAQA
jgi:hypothetical protein